MTILISIYLIGAALSAFVIFRKPSGWPWWLKALGIGAWPLAILGFLVFLGIAKVAAAGDR